MSDKRAVPRRTRRALHAVNERENGGIVPPLWPNESGELQVPGLKPTGAGGMITPGQGAPKGSRSRALPRLQAKPRTATSEQQSSRSFYSWQSQKLLDICSFNAGAESTFVIWLTERLGSEEFGAVTVGWLLSNAAFELDVSIETIKRYLAKHTADRAEFHSDGKIVTLRE